jgi:hypothetical protein
MRKKKLTTDAATALPASTSITCPACKSSVSADGAVLHARSEYLTDLIETDAALEEVEKETAKKLAAAESEIVALQEQLTQYKKLLEKETPKNVVQGKDSGKSKDSWWGSR